MQQLGVLKVLLEEAALPVWSGRFRARAPGIASHWL